MIDLGCASPARAATRRHLMSLGSVAVLLAGAANAQPVVYTDEVSFVAGLNALPGSTIHESFEDGVVWADSRNSISSPGRTPAVTTQGVTWTSNALQNEIATGTVGGQCTGRRLRHLLARPGLRRA